MKTLTNWNYSTYNRTAVIGTGAMIKEGADKKPIIIGRGAVVGMGAVVTKSVPPFTTVIGNPAVPLEKKQR